MDPATLISDGRVGFILVGVCLLIGGWFLLRPRRGKVIAPVPPRGVGAALACALDGDLDAAHTLLLDQIRSNIDQDDALLALFAVLRAQGRYARAEQWVAAISARRELPWLHAVAVRLSIDAGEIERAVTLAADARTPPRLAIAVFVRAGLWAEAYTLIRRHKTLQSNPLVASVLAGWAAWLWREGEDRAARKRLKQAQALHDSALLVLAVAAAHCVKSADQKHWQTLLDDRTRLGPVLDIHTTIEAVAAASDAGAFETALGILRDALDREPAAATLRVAYETLLLKHGSPTDWRAALAERVEMPTTRTHAEGWQCSECGLSFRELYFVCPRCDAFDTLARADRSRPDSGVKPSGLGARLIDLELPT